MNLARQTYAYDAAGRLAVVSDGTVSAGYSYLANSSLIEYTSFTNVDEGSNHSIVRCIVDAVFGFGANTPMPRKLRIEFPGAVYHLMSRGDRREDIFLDLC